MSHLTLRPISLAEANRFVLEHHRHNEPTWGHKFSVGAEADGELVGVAICGRPVARALDDGATIEITRACTDGTKNANSFLYGASCRAAFALGYKRVITYTLQDEGGSSLRASGFKVVGEVKGGRQWSCPSRIRDEKEIYAAPKYRWMKQLEFGAEKEAGMKEG